MPISSDVPIMVVRVFLLFQVWFDVAAMVVGRVSLLSVLLSSVICADTGWPNIDAQIGEPDRCGQQTQHFAQLFSQYSNCVLRASRPLTICLDCMHFRLPLDQALQTIQDDSECANWLLVEDGALVQMKHFYSSLLSRAKCHHCERRVSDDGVEQFVPTDEVRQYVDAQRHFMDCANDVSTCVNTSCSDLCTACRQQYLHSCTALQRCVRHTDSWQTCRDVIDKANVSMRVWEEAGCLPDRLSPGVHLAAFATAACGLLVMLAFYGGLVARKHWSLPNQRDVITSNTSAASDLSLLHSEAPSA